MMRILKTFFPIFIISFLLHFIWETYHLPLYGGYEHLSQGLPITVRATLGDSFYTIGAALFITIIKRRLDWISEANYQDFIALAMLGFGIALFVEYKGLFLNRWHYLPAMPIIPYLRVGLSPILQMAFLLPISIWITKKLPNNKIPC